MRLVVWRERAWDKNLNAKKEKKTSRRLWREIFGKESSVWSGQTKIEMNGF